MTLLIPEEAISYGFVTEGLGTHSSRTMMLTELQLLFAARSVTTDLEGYRSVIVNDNVLLKKTESTRHKSFRHLRELYGLDPNLLVFRALRELWDQIPDAQPMLALLCALARDPSLRSTTDLIVSLSPDASVTSEMIARAAEKQFPSLSQVTTLAKIGRNAASTWTQSGHLLGRTTKVRIHAKSHLTSVTYALLLGHLCGVRGEALFHTLWTRVLDASTYVLREQAIVATQQGWLEYRHAGEVTDISFYHLLNEELHE